MFNFFHIFYFVTRLEITFIISNKNEEYINTFIAIFSVLSFLFIYFYFTILCNLLKAFSNDILTSEASEAILIFDNNSKVLGLSCSLSNLTT